MQQALWPKSLSANGHRSAENAFSVAPESGGQECDRQSHVAYGHGVGHLARSDSIPLRDPLLSLMTRRNRRPDLPADDHLLVWEVAGRLLPLLDQTIPIFYAPIDLARSTEQRIQLLRGLCAHAGVSPELHSTDFGEKWPAGINTSGQYAMKEAYINRDAGFIKRGLGRDWIMLKNLEMTLQPWLERRGYSNLMWWD
jgi:hypothetical protein